MNDGAATAARLYARVSTLEQQEKFGLAAQLTELRAHAARLGYEVVGEYHDAVSGEDDSRPALDRLAAEAQASEAILVHHPDRLSRGGVGPQFLIERALQRTGAAVDYLAIPRGSQGEAEWRLQKEILGSLAAYERAQIGARTARGRREKARQGRIVGGCAPYGYRVVADRLQVHAAEADTVRLMYRLVAEEHRSLRAVAAELNRLGVPTARGKAWRRTTVAQVLSNPTYRGEAYFERTRWTRVDEKSGQVERSV